MKIYNHDDYFRGSACNKSRLASSTFNSPMNECNTKAYHPQLSYQHQSIPNRVPLRKHQPCEGKKKGVNKSDKVPKDRKKIKPTSSMT